MPVPGPLTAVSAVPSIIDKLVAAMPDAVPTGVNVWDGYPVSEDPGDFLMIGIEDPASNDAGRSASVQQGWLQAGSTSRREEGDITCVAVSWNGDGDPKVARDTVYSIAGALSATLRGNPTLDTPTWVVSFGTSLDLLQNQDENGASASLVFTVHFSAII